MKSTFERVAEWNTRCNKLPAKPLTEEYWKALANQVDRIQEELNEAKEAIADRDLVELLDAGCDLDVTVSGYNFLSNLPYEEAISRVLDNNDVKYTTDEVFALESLEEYGEGHEIQCVDGYYSIHRISDNKVCKLMNHPKVTLTDLVFK